ncbi:MAG: nudF 2 [Fibrobacteres bacterium]|nr:nudF 2 [Fibrobacterota bacterium]
MDGVRKSPEGPDRIGPWTRLESREIYENPWIRVREDKVARPDGSPGIYGIIHYKNIAVAVVPIDAEGKVILVGQHRYVFDRYFWEVPEGGCPIGKESPEAAAMRELREETGYTAARWDYLGTLELSNSTSDEIGHLYLARDLTPGSQEPDETEEIEIKRIDFAEAWRMAMEGAITESLTVAALARARHFLDREAAAHPPGDTPADPDPGKRP